MISSITNHFSYSTRTRPVLDPYPTRTRPVLDPYPTRTRPVLNPCSRSGLESSFLLVNQMNKLRMIVIRDLLCKWNHRIPARTRICRARHTFHGGTAGRRWAHSCYYRPSGQNPGSNLPARGSSPQTKHQHQQQKSPLNITHTAHTSSNH